jgi:hypothetical protein
VDSHVSSRTEIARKIWQSHTTTSDAFLVIMTVGFFEVRNINPNTDEILRTDGSGTAETNPANRRLILGKELFSLAPGDTRVRFAAVVDRSQLGFALDAATGAIRDTNTTTPGTQPAQAKNPWFSVTESDSIPPPTQNPTTDDAPFQLDIAGRLLSATQFSVFRNGQAVTIDTTITDSTATDTTLPPILRIGFGDAGTGNLGEGASYRVTAIAQATETDGTPRAGVVRLTLTPLTAHPSGGRLQYYHPAGSMVTNMLLGNPGPAVGSGFSVTTPEGRAVVPVFTEIPAGSP